MNAVYSQMFITNLLQTDKHKHILPSKTKRNNNQQQQKTIRKHCQPHPDNVTIASIGGNSQNTKEKKSGCAKSFATNELSRC